MMPLTDYRLIAEENEAVFRNVLRDLRVHRENMPMGEYIPKDLQTEIKVSAFFERYSAGNRFRKFTVCNFIIEPSMDSAVISFQNIAGGGAELEYLVKSDNQVEFKKALMTFKHGP
jgi:hypothetical protein